MALSTLDPKTALIVVDLQRAIAAHPLAHPLADVVERTNALSEAFRRHDLAVVLVVVAGKPPGRVENGGRSGQTELPPGATDLLPELSQNANDHRVTKRSRSAFAHTDLESYLKSQGVTQVVITGVATSSGVESTARDGYELGFNVTVATDAMTDPSLEAHDHSLAKIFPRLGETGTTREIIDLLEKTR